MRRLSVRNFLKSDRFFGTQNIRRKLLLENNCDILLDLIFFFIIALGVVCFLLGIIHIIRKHAETEDKQMNYWWNPECSCSCYADCEGDVNRCTSKKAKYRGCGHSCNCFIEPMLRQERRGRNK